MCSAVHDTAQQLRKQHIGQCSLCNMHVQVHTDVKVHHPVHGTTNY